MTSSINFFFYSVTCPADSSWAQKPAKHFTQPSPETGKHTLHVPTMHHNGLHLLAYDNKSQTTVTITVLFTYENRK